MSNTPDFHQQPRSIEEQLNELVGEFSGAADPKQEKLIKLAKQAQANQTELKKSIDTLHKLLDYLRVCIKYQAFDIEATRRENEYLRKLLEEGNDDSGHRQGDGGDPDV